MQKDLQDLTFQNGVEFWREHPQVFQLKNAEAKVRLRETLPINPSTRDVEVSWIGKLREYVKTNPII
jgi:hypothetical protein